MLAFPPLKSNRAPSDASSSFPGWLASPPGLALWLALLALSLYWPATSHEFTHFDDPAYYAENPHVQAGLGWDGIVWAFTTDTGYNWHPVTWLSLMLDADLSDGPDAAMPHFTNVLFHALNSALLFLFLWHATGAKWRSALVAGLFAVHPLNVESVAWVAERKNVLNLFFGLLSLLAYVRFTEEAGLSRPLGRKFYAASLAAFALALMSKPMVVTLPFVLLLLDVWPLGRVAYGPGTMAGLARPRFKLREKLPFFAFSLADCVITYLVQKNGRSVYSSAVFPLPGRLENAVVSYARYLGKALWPENLAVFYPHPGHWPWVPTLLATALVALVSLVVVWRMRTSPWAFTGWFWFLGTLVPVIGLVQTGKQAMADRHAYLPLIGIFILAVWGGYAVLTRRQAVPALALFLGGTLLLGAEAITARHQLNYWQNDGTLFGHALAVTPDNPLAEVALGFWLEKVQRPAEAAEHYRQALALDPNDATTHYDLANVQSNAGQWPAAIEQYRAAIRCDPDQFVTYYNLAVALEQSGQPAAAIAAYQAALRLKPDLDAAKQHLQALGVTVE